MNLPWRRSQEDRLRPLVLGNLERLQRLFHARGRRFEFNRELSTERLEKGLWGVLDDTVASMGLTLPDGMACERRIDEIQRQLEPMPPPGSSSGQWPAFLQSAR